MNGLLTILVALSLSNLVEWKAVKTEWIDENTVCSVMCNEQREPHCVVVIATKAMGIVLYGYQEEEFKVFNLFNQETETPFDSMMKKLLYEYCSDI